MHRADGPDALLHSTVDRIPAMLAYWDADQRCRFANRAYERWFGVSPEALIGKHISELLGPIYELNRPYIEGALRGQQQEFEREIPDPAGGPPRHSLANYIPDVADSVVRGFYVLVTDISAIKRAEQALKESEARFAGIISISPDAIVSVDEDQRIILFNEGAEKIFGHARADIIGRDLGLLLPERLRESHRRRLATFMAGNESSRQIGARSSIIVGVRKDGDEFPAEAAISKLEIGGTKVLTVALRDITERRRTEMEQTILAEAGAVLGSSLNYRQTLGSIAKLIVQNAADICVVDMVEADAKVERLTVAHADPTKASACAALARLSLDQSHTLGRSVFETKQPQIFDDITPEFLASAAQNEDHLRALRELGPRSALVVPLISADAVIGALVLGSTRPNRYGPRDLALATELARRAALAIENARLYEAEQRAKRARDEVLGIVAHDVRAPLNAIYLAAQLLARKLAKAGQTSGVEDVDSIVRSVKRANCLIEDLLDVSRIEAGVLGLARRVVAVKSVLADLLGSQQLLASAASIDLQLDIDDDLPEVWADRGRLLQVLENLVGNALKFTQPEGRITIAAAKRRGEILVSVADTGAGIPPQNLTLIFDRFWQAERAERRGAGLGLPICKGIIEGHGGRIWVESAPGQGSTFFFTLPVAAGEASRHETPATA